MSSLHRDYDGLGAFLAVLVLPDDFHVGLAVSCCGESHSVYDVAVAFGGKFIRSNNWASVFQMR